MDVPAHQFGGGSIDHPVPLDRRDTGERRRRDDHVEMAAFACAGMAGVLRTVVTDLEAHGMERRFERGPQPRDALGRHVGESFVNRTSRSAQNIAASVATIAMGGAIHTLKVTHSVTLRWRAIQMFAVPSAR